MKKWLWLSLVLGISFLPLQAAGNLALSFKAGVHQRGGIYKDLYGSGKFALGGVVAYEVARFYRSNIIAEFNFDFDTKTDEVVVEHIGGSYTYEQSLSRSGYGLGLRYENNFSNDGFSLAARMQRDFEKETIAESSRKLGIWRPVLSGAFEMNLGSGGKQRFFIGTEFKLNVDGHVEAGLFAGLKMTFNLFRRFES